MMPRKKIDLLNCDSTSFRSIVPMCTDADTFKKWVDAARANKPTGRIGFCEDCTPEYQSMHIQMATCENPGVMFTLDNHGFISGTLPTRTEIKIFEADVKRQSKGD